MAEKTRARGRSGAPSQSRPMPLPLPRKSIALAPSSNSIRAVSRARALPKSGVSSPRDVVPPARVRSTASRPRRMPFSSASAAATRGKETPSSGAIASATVRIPSRIAGSEGFMKLLSSRKSVSVRGPSKTCTR